MQPSGLNASTSHRVVPAGRCFIRRSARVIASPAASSPWMQPTTRTRRREPVGPIFHARISRPLRARPRRTETVMRDVVVCRLPPAWRVGVASHRPIGRAALQCASAGSSARRSGSREDRTPAQPARRAEAISATRKCPDRTLLRAKSWRRRTPTRCCSAPDPYLNRARRGARCRPSLLATKNAER